jgi:serine/threonine protein kinase
MDPDLDNGGPYTWYHDIYALGKSMRELLTGNREKSWITPVPGPDTLGKLIDRMTCKNLVSRPSIQEVYQTLQNLLHPVEVQAEQTSGIGWWIAGIGAALLYATANSYDSNAERYRDSQGKFTKGRWG